MRRILLRAVTLILLSASIVMVQSCGANTDFSKNSSTESQTIQMTDPSPENPDGQESVEVEVLENDLSAIMEFGVRLFREDVGISGLSNNMLSPISIFMTLSMAANGAVGNTLSQMENTLGMPLGKMNGLNSKYLKSLKDDETLQLANSIWMNTSKDMLVKKSFTGKIETSYDSEVYGEAFNTDTVKKANRWVDEKTKGRIDKIVEELQENTIMVLLNAAAFDAEWQNVYTKDEIWERPFTGADRKTVETEFMHHVENMYLEDEDTTGFIKYYQGGTYAFAALLPEEEMDLMTYIQNLDGKKICRLIDHAESIKVETAMPKFESEYAASLNEALSMLGMPQAFDKEKADFSGMCELKPEEIVYIDRVLHKTFIAVDERGTKAGAATAVTMEVNESLQEHEDIKRVILDRPFLYLIYDCENGMPLFLGAVTEL